MDEATGTPRLLLVEDDTISRNFMQAALRALPAEVDAVATAAEAIALPGPHALWLIDARLPDISGAHLLRTLRLRAPATVALAHTADPSADQRQALLDAGFEEVLIKPLPAAHLQDRVRSRLPLSAAGDWNEDAALRALNGNRDHVAMLRTLFIDELPGALRTIDHAFDTVDGAAMSAQLHKLRASCGFVGAQRLEQAVIALQRSPASSESMQAFRQAARALLR